MKYVGWFEEQSLNLGLDVPEVSRLETHAVWWSDVLAHVKEIVQDDPNQ